MTLVMVCVFDRAVMAFGRPVFVNAVGQALRSFRDEVNSSEGGQVHAHPDDFDLYQLGFFDDSEGTFEPAKQMLVRAKDCKES